MAQRFGRNQRRKMRDQIAESQLRERSAMQQWRASADDNHRLRARLRNAIEVEASLRRDLMDPSVFLARIDMSKAMVESEVVQMRVSEMTIREALYDRTAQTSLANRLSEMFLEKIVYAR